MNEFGAYIRELRKRKNLSLKQVAEKGGISHSYLSQVETGKRNSPKPELLKKIAMGLDVSFIDLAEKAGIFDMTGDPISFYNKNKDSIQWKEATQENLDSLQEEQRKAGLDLKEVLKATSSVPLYYGEEFISAAQKRQILKLVKAVLEE